MPKYSRAYDRLCPDFSIVSTTCEYWPCRSGWRKPGTRSAAPGWCPSHLVSRSGSRFHWWCERWWWAAAPIPRGCAAEERETEAEEELRKCYRGFAFRGDWGEVVPCVKGKRKLQLGTRLICLLKPKISSQLFEYFGNANSVILLCLWCSPHSHNR